MVRLRHSLSDALAFGPPNLEPVSGCIKYALHKGLPFSMYHVMMSHDTPPSESVCANGIYMQRKDLKESLKVCRQCVFELVYNTCF